MNKQPILSLLFHALFRKKSRSSTIQKNRLISLQQSCTANNIDDWRKHWQQLGQPWRTEPEIDVERKIYLTKRRDILPDFKQGIYPFKDEKLNRADVEWLLATHENGRGPVDWSYQCQRERVGIDVRGADLKDVNLSELPLAKLRGGVTPQERLVTTLLQRNEASVHLERANLSQVHLEGAWLRNVHFDGANLELAHLEGAYCGGAFFKGAYLGKAYLGNTYLRRAYFDAGTFLDDVSLGNEHVGFTIFIDVNWGGVNLATVQWQKMSMIGSERKAVQKRTEKGQLKDTITYLHEYESAVRANRQLGLELQSQGLNEDAVRFSYRAQVLQKKVLWYQTVQRDVNLKQRLRALGAWLFSWFLFLLAGYGYKPERSFLSYLLVITAFATAYFIIGHTVGPVLSPLGSFVFSMTSFHGRGFFPGGIGLDDPLTVLAALEAFVGLLIEVTFIAALTQRLFGK